MRLKACGRAHEARAGELQALLPGPADGLVGGRERAARGDRLGLRAAGRPSTFYGHVEELRWRLRFKAEADVDEDLINPIIATFVEPDGRRRRRPARAGARADREPAGRADRRRPAGQRPTRVARTRQFTGAIRAQTPEEIEKALARQKLPGLEGSTGRARRRLITRVRTDPAFALEYGATDQGRQT